MDDHARLLDQRETVFHAVGERRAGGGQQRARIPADAVAGGERDEERRLMGGVAESPEDLMPRSTPRRIDGRPRQDERPDSLRAAHGKLGRDLAAHRARNEQRPVERDRIEPGAEVGRQLADARCPARSTAAPVARQVDDGDGAPNRKRLRQRLEIPPGDAVAVHEDDGGTFPADERVDAHAVHVAPAAHECPH